MLSREKMKSNSEGCKLLVVGDKKVGKSSFIIRYTDNEFNSVWVPFDFKVKNINYQNKSIKLQIWEPGKGGEMYKNPVKLMCVSCSGVVIAYDISNRTSFNSVENWIKDIKEYTQGEAILV